MFNKKTNALQEIILLLREVSAKLDDHLDYSQGREKERHSSHMEYLKNQIEFHERDIEDR